MKKKKSEDTYTVRLRTAAEELLHSREINEDDRKKGLDEIFQELQVYQIELELQNDELSLANEDLEWQRLRFTNIYELAPVGYFILTRTGMISEVNAAALQLLGTGSSSVTGRLFHHFVDSDSLDTFYLFFRKLISSYKNDGCTLKLSVKNGKPFHVRLEGIYLKQINQCYLAVLDLTEIIEIRGKLAETNERLQMAMEASLAGTWELNPESMAFKFDDLGYRFCRVDEDRFGGDYNSFLKLVHPDDRSMVDFQFRTAFNTSKKLDLVCRLANPENEQCFAGLRGHMLRRADGREVLIGIIMDYSEKNAWRPKPSSCAANIKKKSMLRC
jgi:PAS domain S-box-containing protein